MHDHSSCALPEIDIAFADSLALTLRRGIMSARAPDLALLRAKFHVGHTPTTLGGRGHIRPRARCEAYLTKIAWSYDASPDRISATKVQGSGVMPPQKGP